MTHSLSNQAQWSCRSSTHAQPESSMVSLVQSNVSSMSNGAYATGSIKNVSEVRHLAVCQRKTPMGLCSAPLNGLTTYPLAYTFYPADPPCQVSESGLICFTILLKSSGKLELVTYKLIQTAPTASLAIDSFWWGFFSEPVRPRAEQPAVSTERKMLANWTTLLFSYWAYSVCGHRCL